MANQTQIDQITERVERLLLRYEELQRTNELLAEQVGLLTQERDSSSRAWARRPAPASTPCSNACPGSGHGRQNHRGTES